MPVGLRFAEETFDLQTETTIFQGETSSTTTGRVLLHAVDPGERALCGRDFDGLEAIGRDWDESYLPHLARCRGCATEAGLSSQTELQFLDPADLSSPPTGLPVTGIDIRTASGTERERQGADALRLALAGHDLRRYLLTDVVTINDGIRGGFSHPLTLSPATMLRGPQAALSTFLHEQMHWIQGPGVDAATTEAAERCPDPPPPPAGGHDAKSSWLHLCVCSLEYVSLAEVIGEADAVALLSQRPFYSWMYGQILADPAWFKDLLARHGLRAPDAPPVPRRYRGPDWWTSIPGVVKSADQQASQPSPIA